MAESIDSAIRGIEEDSLVFLLVKVMKDEERFEVHFITRVNVTCFVSEGDKLTEINENETINVLLVEK